MNANAGLTDEQIDAGLVAGAFMFIDILPGDSAELDCGQPQGSAEPGLVYCTTGGTGEVNTGEPINDFPPFRFPPFPDCCDPDGDGIGTMVPNPGGHGSPLMALIPRATNDQIGSGDVMIQRVSTDGVETEFVSTLQYIFATSPALVSYDDGQGNSATISYPFPGEIDGLRNDLPVEAGPDGDVVLDLTFWRPQRRPIPPETGDWIDMGELRYYATLGNHGSAELHLRAGRLLELGSEPDPSCTRGQRGVCHRRRVHRSLSRSACEPGQHTHLPAEPDRLPGVEGDVVR